MDPASEALILGALQADSGARDTQTMPLLAHYTSLDVLEKIVRSNEVWFSHPMLMNDHAEVRGGLLEGVTFLEQSDILKSALSRENYTNILSGFHVELSNYGNVHLFDTFIFSLSEHDPEDNDGRLSMWRGYGANGNGVAIVFDPRKLSYGVNIPLILDRVEYRSRDEQRTWMSEKLSKLIAVIETLSLTGTDFEYTGRMLFHCLKIAALFCKHKGFEEEREWRIVYLPEHDAAQLHKHELSFFNGPRGLEPKLKYKIEPIPDVTIPDLSLGKIIDRIILGPSRSSPLVGWTATRMLREAGHPELASRLKASGIPFRPVT